MSLRVKTIYILAALLLTTFLLLISLGQWFWRKSYTNLEEYYVNLNVERVESALNKDKITLVNNCRDWSAWDDTYKYMVDQNIGYYNSNIAVSSFPASGFDFMVFNDTQGKLVIGKQFDHDSEQMQELPPALKNLFTANKSWTNIKNIDQHFEGIVLLPAGPAFIASQPILTSNYKGPVRGTFIAGHYLSNRYLAELTSLTRIDTQLLPLNSLTNRDIPALLLTKTSNYSRVPLIEPLSSQYTSGYKIIKDINGKPAMLLQVIVPRKIFLHGLNSFWKFTTLWTFCTISFFVMIIFLLSKLILQRIEKLNREVTAVGSLESRVTVGGADEVTSLAQAINGMLNSIEHAHWYDAATGLYNRSYFEKQLISLEPKKTGAAAIIVGDIDGLKLVNDTMGFDAGDTLLRETARILRECAGNPKIIARMGGDEFAILLEDQYPGEHNEIVNQIKKAVRRYNQANPELPLSLSLGASQVGDRSIMFTELYREAASYMYREKLHRSRSGRSSLVAALTSTLEARDYITEGHAERLQILIEKLARNMGLLEHHITDLKLFAQFHDIGKVGIPDHILNKPGKLNRDEWEEMQRHSEIGYRIAQAAPELHHISEWILKHHEWWNGKGYPLGISGFEIPLESRMLAIADAYDAMTNDRPYHLAMAHTEALRIIREQAGTQFDPDITRRFLEIMSGEQLESAATDEP